MVRKKRADVSPKSAPNVEVQIPLKNRGKFLTFLENSYEVFNRIDFAKSDPIFFPLSYSGNKEFIGFIASIFAYGRVSLIQKFLINFFQVYGTEPCGIIKPNNNIYYRFQQSKDIQLIYNFLSEIYDRYGSVNAFFTSSSDDLEAALKSFILYGRVFGEKFNGGQGYFQLFPDPEKSGLKRIRMFLRWMIRSDNLDMGLWKGYLPRDLLYPVDTHILRFAEATGIVKNNHNSIKTSREITSFFAEINQDDPVKYDFTITRLGMLCGCTYVRSPHCDVCSYANGCPF